MVPTGMPECAVPQSYRKGRLSYTIIAPSSGAKIEVLLKQKAFRITKVGEENGKLEKPKKGCFLICEFAPRFCFYRAIGLPHK